MRGLMDDWRKGKAFAIKFLEELANGYTIGYFLLFFSLILTHIDGGMKRMNKNIDIDMLIADSSYINSAVSALLEMSRDFLQGSSTKLEDINKIQAIIASIQCLADRHAKDMEKLDKVTQWFI